MTRKQATIAVRSGLNDDEQYGCVVPPIHLSSTYNFTGFNEPRAHDYSRRGNPTRDVVQRALAYTGNGFAYGLRVFSKIVHRRGYKGRLFYKDRMDALLLFAFVDSEIAAA